MNQVTEDIPNELFITNNILNRNVNNITFVYQENYTQLYFVDNRSCKICWCMYTYTSK